MKIQSTFAPSTKSVVGNIQFPVVRQWKGDDKFDGGIVCFIDETTFLVLYSPEGCYRYFGEIVTEAISITYGEH